MLPSVSHVKRPCFSMLPSFFTCFPPASLLLPQWLPSHNITQGVKKKSAKNRSFLPGGLARVRALLHVHGFMCVCMYVCIFASTLQVKNFDFCGVRHCEGWVERREGRGEWEEKRKETETPHKGAPCAFRLGCHHQAQGTTPGRRAVLSR